MYPLRTQGDPDAHPDHPPHRRHHLRALKTSGGGYALEGIIAAYPTFHYRGMDVRVTPEIVLGEVLNIAEMRKALRTKTIFQVNGTEYQIKAAYDATVAAQIRGMYPDAVILNEDPAYAVAA